MLPQKRSHDVMPIAPSSISPTSSDLRLPLNRSHLSGSYYRCTAARCGVKKLVERSQQDPSTVITTYEGRHAHPSPVVAHRGAHMFMAAGATDIYSPIALQHQRLGFFPADFDTYAHMCTQPTTMAHRLSEYDVMPMHTDLLPGALMGYQHGNREVSYYE